MHGNSLRGVSLTRTAHPAGLGPLAEADRVAVAGRAPAGAVHPIAMVRAATATGTRHRSRNRPGGRDIGPTPSQTLTPREIGANRPMNHTVPQRRGHGQIPGPPFRRRPVPVRRCRTSCPRAPARWSRPARPGRIRTRHPAGRRPVPAVVRQLDEHRLPELIVAAVARDSHMSQPRPAASRIRLAQARRPAHLRRAGPQFIPERAHSGSFSSKEADT